MTIFFVKFLLCMSNYFTRVLIDRVGGEDKEALDLIITQHGAQLISTLTLVNMSKQSGRDLNIPGANTAEEIDLSGAQDALGSEDRLLSMQIATEREKAIERGLASSSNQRRTPGISMHLQSSRTGVVPGSGTTELDDNGHIIDDKFVLDLDVEGSKTGKNI